MKFKYTPGCPCCNKGCQPICTVCNDIPLATNATVEGDQFGSHDITYDFARQAYYSAWIPFTSDNVLTSGIGQSPCFSGNGSSYFFYRVYGFVPDGIFGPTKFNGLYVDLCIPGQLCYARNGKLTIKYIGYSGPAYPGLLGDPATTPISFITARSVLSFEADSCDPPTFNVVWDNAVFSAYGVTNGLNLLPVKSAVVSLPKFIDPGYDFSCMLPCPVPERDLTVSWTTSEGNGSATLVYDENLKEWKSPCSNGLIVRVYNHTSIGSSTTQMDITHYNDAQCQGPFDKTTSPIQLGLTSYVCDPLMVVFKIVFPASKLYQAGYRTFTITL